jgi:hypothetical protein
VPALPIGVSTLVAQQAEGVGWAVVFQRGVARIAYFLLLAGLTAARDAAAATFVEVPATFGGTGLVITGISGDGQVLVGRTILPGPLAGIRWTQATGWQDLGAPAGRTHTRVADTSFDGSEVAGTGDPGGGAFRWVQGIGWGSQLFPGEAAAISADGSVVAGTYQTIIFPGAAPDPAIGPVLSTVLYAWREGIGATWQVAADPPWWFDIGGITGDGGAVVGTRTSIIGHMIPMRFAVTGGGVQLRVAPEGVGNECVELIDNPCTGQALSVSADGTTVAGAVELATGLVPPHAARWIGSAAPPVFLDGGPPAPPSSGHDVSGDGHMIVGARDGAAFLLTAGGGMQDLKGLLEGHGVDLTGWTLANAQFISDDGSVIAGTGTRPGGAFAIWLAQAPELVPVAPVPSLGARGGLVLGLALAAWVCVRGHSARR